MKSLKELAKESKWIFSFWGLLVIIAILNLFNFSFISNSIQFIYYGLYFSFTFIILLIIIKKSDFKMRQLIITLINLIAMIIAVKNEFIALPFLLVFPLLGTKKLNFISIILSTFTYFIAFIWIMFFLIFGRMNFSTNEEIANISSPNGVYNLVVISNDQGALGGATITNLDKIYLKILKYRKLVFFDDWGVENQIKWIDNKNFNIDGHIINVNTKKVIYGDR